MVKWYHKFIILGAYVGWSTVNFLTMALSRYVGMPLNLWHKATTIPDLLLPSEPQSITALWMVANYAVWLTSDQERPLEP